MLKVRKRIEKFKNKGEKSSWRYLAITANQAKKLHSVNRKSFRVKGTIDHVPIHGIAVMPLGNGQYIIPLNANLRNQLQKESGDFVTLELILDTKIPPLNADLLMCINDEPLAASKFNQIPPSHQRYYSKWVEAAKTTSTQANRIARIINGLLNNYTFAEILKSKI